MRPLTFDESPWRFIYKTARLEQSLIVGVSTWLIALLSNGPLWFNPPKVAVALCMFCSCMGASLYHYGRRADIYARKPYDTVLIMHPWRMKLMGSMLFAYSMLIAFVYLPIQCFWIAVLNYAIIMFYANFLDQYWPFKNLVIAFVCATPIIAGWFSGHRMHPIVPSLIIAIYGIYLSREILKDVIDRRANHGKRFTMVMSLGVVPSLRIAGVILLISVGILAYASHYLPVPQSHALFQTSAGDLFTALILALFGLGIIFPLHLGWQLTRGRRFENYYRYVDCGMVSLMFAMLGVRAGL